VIFIKSLNPGKVLLLLPGFFFGILNTHGKSESRIRGIKGFTGFDVVVVLFSTGLL
jgi:hypothetical protein